MIGLDCVNKDIKQRGLTQTDSQDRIPELQLDNAVCCQPHLIGQTYHPKLQSITMMMILTGFHDTNRTFTESRCHQPTLIFYSNPNAPYSRYLESVKPKATVCPFP